MSTGYISMYFLLSTCILKRNKKLSKSFLLTRFDCKVDWPWKIWAVRTPKCVILTVLSHQSWQHHQKSLEDYHGVMPTFLPLPVSTECAFLRGAGRCGIRSPLSRRAVAVFCQQPVPLSLGIHQVWHVVPVFGFWDDGRPTSRPVRSS